MAGVFLNTSMPAHEFHKLMSDLNYEMLLGDSWIMMNEVAKTQRAHLRSLYEELTGNSLPAAAKELLGDPPGNGKESKEERSDRLHRAADQLACVPESAMTEHREECGCAECPHSAAEIARCGLPYPLLRVASENDMLNVLEQVLVDKALFFAHAETPEGAVLDGRRGRKAAIYCPWVSIGSGAMLNDGTINIRCGLVELFAHMGPWDTAGCNRWSRIGRTATAGDMVIEIITRTLGVFCWGEVVTHVARKGRQKAVGAVTEGGGAAAASSAASSAGSGEGGGVAAASSAGSGAGSGAAAATTTHSGLIPTDNSIERPCLPRVQPMPYLDPMVLGVAEVAVLEARRQLASVREEARRQLASVREGLSINERATSVLEELAALASLLEREGADAHGTSVAADTLARALLLQTGEMGGECEQEGSSSGMGGATTAMDRGREHGLVTEIISAEREATGGALGAVGPGQLHWRGGNRRWLRAWPRHFGAGVKS
jgi:hypothetical protein